MYITIFVNICICVLKQAEFYFYAAVMFSDGNQLRKDKATAVRDARTETKTESESDREQQQPDRGLRLPSHQSYSKRPPCQNTPQMRSLKEERELS